MPHALKVFWWFKVGGTLLKAGAIRYVMLNLKIAP